VENGVVKAIVLPYVLRFNADAARDGLRKMAAALSTPRPQAEPLVATVVDALELLFGRLGTPRRLRDVGVPRDVLPEVAERAMSDWFLRGNPREVGHHSELREVLQEAW
jgi:alcohol dehydrogenase class IV